MPTVTVRATDSGGAFTTRTASWSVSSPPPADWWLPTRIGMSAPKAEWANRVAEVGTLGLKARRIFADLANGPSHQTDLINQAVGAGQMPVVSYKVGGDFVGAANGTYDTRAAQAAEILMAFDVEMAVCVWHEPNSDMTGAQFVALQRRMLPFFKGKGKLKFGPIMNGFLLTQPSQPAGLNEWETFNAPDLLAAYDYYGEDAYQSGTSTNPGPVNPDDKVTALLNWLNNKGYPDMPIGVGEYNGFSAQGLTDMGEVLLDSERCFFGCVWNVDEARAGILTGTRLTAYKGTKADPRARK